MTAPRAIDVSGLPDYSISSESPVWWGQLFLAAIEGSMFFILIAMYFAYRMDVDVWPPPGTQYPPLLMATAGLIVLIASAWGVYWAGEGAKKDDRAAMVLGMFVNLVLGFAFVGLQVSAWRNLNFDWKVGVHGSIVWAILSLHMLDTAADLLFTLVLFRIALLGPYSARLRLAVHVDSIVWYFIVLIWIPLYVCTFWGPRIVGTP